MNAGAAVLTEYRARLQRLTNVEAIPSISERILRPFANFLIISLLIPCDISWHDMLTAFGARFAEFQIGQNFHDWDDHRILRTAAHQL
jgi:hypothetical protein